MRSKKLDTQKILVLIMCILGIGFSIAELVISGGWTTSGDGVAKTFVVGIIPIALCVIFYFNQNIYVCMLYCVLFVYNRLNFLIESQGNIPIKIILIVICVYNIIVLYICVKKQKEADGPQEPDQVIKRK